MLELARPSLLLAGAAAALLPLLLHLINRRPPERVALPTARFLRPDPRTRLRLDRRPTDLPLLLLRMLLVLLLFTALAGPRWRPGREGTAELVLLERGAAMEPFWTDAVEHARTRLIDDNGRARGGLALFDTAATVFPASTVDAALLDSLAAAGPDAGAPARTDYATGLRALRELADVHARVDSARVTLVTRAAWESWTSGLSELRPAAWPGSLELIDVGYGTEGVAAADAASPALPSNRRALVLGDDESAGQFVAAALGALGWQATREPSSGGLDALRRGERQPELLVLLPPTRPAVGRQAAPLTAPTLPADTADEPAAAPEPTRPADTDEPTPLAEPTLPADSGDELAAAPEPTGPGDTDEPVPLAESTFPADSDQTESADPKALLDRVRDGATLVVSGWPDDRLAEALPWRVRADSARFAGQASDLVLDNGVRLTGGTPAVGGAPTAEARWVAAWADARPAAAAAPHGSGCLVYVNTALEDGPMPLSESFPAAIERLMRGCEPPADRERDGTRAAGPLDEGARAALRADDLPGTAALASLAGESAATPLFRWFLVVAAVVALLETILAYRSRREGSRP